MSPAKKPRAKRMVGGGRAPKPSNATLNVMFCPRPGGIGMLIEVRELHAHTTLSASITVAVAQEIMGRLSAVLQEASDD